MSSLPTRHGPELYLTTGGALSNEGFYANVGDTRRPGVEAALAGKPFDDRIDWYANYRVYNCLRFFAGVDHVFNRGYCNFGIIGDATDLHPNATGPRFFSPGEPRGGWLAVGIDL
jgi:hypothetical protein